MYNSGMKKDEEALEQLRTLAQHPDLVDKLDEVTPGLKSQIYGSLMSPWLP
jgi:hypothetical protein